MSGPHGIKSTGRDFPVADKIRLVGEIMRRHKVREALAALSEMPAAFAGEATKEMVILDSIEAEISFIKLSQKEQSKKDRYVPDKVVVDRLDLLRSVARDYRIKTGQTGR
jgi:hypothetical protein